MDRNILSRLNSMRDARRAAVLVTDLGSGEQQLLAEGEPVEAGVAAAVSSAFQSGKSAKLDMEGRSLFLNVHLPPVRIVVIGAVRIADALAPMAALCGFNLSIIEPRQGFAQPGSFEEGRLVVGLPTDRLAVDPYTAVVAVAHLPELDDAAIAAGLRGGSFYVGALGSRRNHSARLERLRAKGLGEAELARIHAPIGLDIGASNPAEIAVAILAEIIQSLRRRPLDPAEGI